MKHRIHLSFIRIDSEATDDSNVQMACSFLDLITCTVGLEGQIAINSIRELEKCGISVKIEREEPFLEKWAK